jgi:hypothetical protein
MKVYSKSRIFGATLLVLMSCSLGFGLDADTLKHLQEASRNERIFVTAVPKDPDLRLNADGSSVVQFQVSGIRFSMSSPEPFQRDSKQLTINAPRTSDLRTVFHGSFVDVIGEPIVAHASVWPLKPGDLLKFKDSSLGSYGVVVNSGSQFVQVAGMERLGDPNSVTFIEEFGYTVNPDGTATFKLDKLVGKQTALDLVRPTANVKNVVVQQPVFDGLGDSESRRVETSLEKSIVVSRGDAERLVKNVKNLSGILSKLTDDDRKYLIDVLIPESLRLKLPDRALEDIKEKLSRNLVGSGTQLKIWANALKYCEHLYKIALELENEIRNSHGGQFVFFRSQTLEEVGRTGLDVVKDILDLHKDTGLRHVVPGIDGLEKLSEILGVMIGTGHYGDVELWTQLLDTANVTAWSYVFVLLDPFGKSLPREARLRFADALHEAFEKLTKRVVLDVTKFVREKSLKNFEHFNSLVLIRKFEPNRKLSLELMWRAAQEASIARGVKGTPIVSILEYYGRDSKKEGPEAEKEGREVLLRNGFTVEDLKRLHEDFAELKRQQQAILDTERSGEGATACKGSECKAQQKVLADVAPTEPSCTNDNPDCLGFTQSNSCGTDLSRCPPPFKDQFPFCLFFPDACFGTGSLTRKPPPECETPDECPPAGTGPPSECDTPGCRQTAAGHDESCIGPSCLDAEGKMLVSVGERLGMPQDTAMSGLQTNSTQVDRSGLCFGVTGQPCRGMPRPFDVPRVMRFQIVPNGNFTSFKGLIDKIPPQAGGTSSK